ncbi:hypothetical protein NHQ30_011316 [Ciborinia camelliae]|nr:hypothetical protein NHQ30_011316 [Ciborinia camelliae]
MTTSSLARLNPRHLRSSEYLLRFCLEVQHKPALYVIESQTQKQKVSASTTQKYKIGRAELIEEENKRLEIDAANPPLDFKRGILYAKPDEIYNERHPGMPKARSAAGSDLALRGAVLDNYTIAFAAMSSGSLIQKPYITIVNVTLVPCEEFSARATHPP